MPATRADPPPASPGAETEALALAGRVVLITGASGGLGSATATAVARAGAIPVLLGHRVPKLQRLYDQLEAAGAEPAIYPLDLAGASPTDYAEMAQRIDDSYGRLDGICHCAASFQGLTALEQTVPEDFLRPLHVNVSAAWLLTQACLPLLRRSPDSALVFTLDDPVRAGGAYWGGYGVALRALEGLVETLAAELENSPVRVGALRPGPMRTPLRGRAWFGEDAGQWPAPEAYGPAMVHLLSPAGIDRRGRVWTPEPAQ